MTAAVANDEFVAGYIDGRDPNTPEPSANRSHAYRHSFGVGRSELAGIPVDPQRTRQSAEEAEAKDVSA